MFLKSSELLLEDDPLMPLNRKLLRSSTDIFTSSTDTPNVDWLNESRLSNTNTTQVKFELFPFVPEGPEGRRVEV
jgi:hypothetical protein